MLADYPKKKQLYLRPDEGMIKGVCAGIADYFAIPVRLVRIIMVLSTFFGFFMLTIIAYVFLAFWLEPAPANMADAAGGMTADRQLDGLEAQFRGSEQRLRQVERYVTSETFGLRNRFRQL